jgi:uroporphyrinogen decarboxylase
MLSPRLASLWKPARGRAAVPILTQPGVEAIGRRMIECVTDGAVHAAAVMAVAQRYPTDASTMVMDLSVEAEAFGAPVAFTDHEVPTVTGRLVSDQASVEALAVPGVDAGRLPCALDAARRIADGVRDRPVLAGCIGPFSLAARLYGMTEIMTACYLEAEVIARLLEKCAALLRAYALAFKAAGADGLVMAEPAAGLLSGEMCDAFSSPYVRQVVEAVQDDGFLFVLHNCGNRGQCTASMVSTGARALHFGNQADLVEALRAVPPDRLVLGNVDPAGVIRLGAPELVERTTAALLDATAPYPNFALSTGCDTPPGAPEANLRAFFAALERFNGRAGRA